VTDWPRHTLGEVLELLIDHRGKTVKKLGGSFQESGVRVVSAINIKGSRINDENPRYVSEAIFRKWMPNQLRRGDVLLTSEAPLGEMAYVESDLEACLGQRLFALRANPQMVDGRYLYYALSWGPSHEEILSRATGTTVVGIRQAELVKVTIALPPLAEQRGIAEMLGSLDDKIESNRRTISLLNDLMESVYRASLREQSLLAAEVLSPVLGGTPRRDESSYWNGVVPWSSAKDVTANEGSVILTTAEMISYEGVANSAAKVLPAGTTVITARGTVGAMARLGAPMAFNQSCYGLIPVDGISPLEVYWSMRLAVAELRRMAHGTVFDTITMATFSNIELRLPRADIRETVLGQLTSFDMLLQAKLRESSILSILRSALLPLLITGRIQVHVASELVESS